MTATRRLLACSLTLLGVSALPGAAQTVDEATVREVEDAALEPFRRELLDLAYAAAATFPHDPHVKNRGRAIESVVLTCLGLDQPRLALRYNEGISNWRRGAGYAEYAGYCAERDALAEVDTYLERALEVADTAPEAQQQEWRADRIRSRVAPVRALLGQDAEARALEAGVEPSESGAVHAVEAGRADEDDFDALIEALDATVALSDFDLSRNALNTYLALLDRFHDDAERSALIVERMEVVYPQLPRLVWVESLEARAGLAADHGDFEDTLALVDEIEASFDELRWRPQDRVPLTARLAVLRHRAGDEATARTRLDGALTLYDDSLAELESFERAATLRPIAAAWARLGEPGRALELYRRTAEEGAINPNLRPRIEDLTATCTSMAETAIEPDEALWKRLRGLRAELADSVSEKP
jgi:hypothetical protein